MTPPLHPEPSPERRLQIDTLRGLACLLLVGFHVIGNNAGAGLLLAPEHPLSRLNEILGYLRMPLFSVLSGCVYAWRPYDGRIGPFLGGKMRRLLVPMLLVGTAFALLQWATPGTNAGQYDWTLLHVIPVAHYWFLEALFIIFLVVVLLESLGWLSRPSRLMAVWVCAAIVYSHNELPFYFALSGVAYLLPFFLLGLALTRFPAAFLSGPVVLGATAWLLAVTAYAVARDAAPEWTSLTALGLSASACLLLLRSGLAWRWLAWVGTASFAIYLFHSVFTAASRIALMRMGVTDIGVLFASGMAWGLGGPILLALVLRRLPLGHWPLGESHPRRSNHRDGKVRAGAMAEPTS